MVSLISYLGAETHESSLVRLNSKLSTFSLMSGLKISKTIVEIKTNQMLKMWCYLLILIILILIMFKTNILGCCLVQA